MTITGKRIMYSSLSTALVVVCVVFLALASCFVTLRFRVRATTEAGVGADDYLILAALLVQYANAGISIYGAVAGGLGDSRLNHEIHPDENIRYAKVLYAGAAVFPLAIVLIKTSTLKLYQRIFVTRWFRNTCYVVMGLTTAWFLVSEFGHIFSTNPPSNYWNRPYDFVIKYGDLLLISAVLNSVLDLTIVILPLFIINTLHMSSRRKLLVSYIFLLGAFCVIASIVRLYYFVKYEQEPQNLTVIVYAEIWTFIEPQMSIVAACLPTLAPLFRDGRDPASVIRTVRSIFFLRGNSPGQKKDPIGPPGKNSSRREVKLAKDSWRKLNPGQGHSNDVVYNESVPLDDLNSQSPPSDAIVVQKSFTNAVEMV